MKLFKVLSLSLFAAASCFSVAYAQLLITPLQVVMEGRDRSASIILVNNSEQSNTYRLLWEQFVQVDGLGGYAPVEDMGKYNVVLPEGTRDLKDFAVFSPRQITLEPGEKQTVRISVRRPSDLAEGEHKSHLKFRVLPAEQGVSAVPDPSLAPNEVSFGARINASFSIPIVYRVGDYNINVELQRPDFEVNDKTGLINIKIPVVRSGLHGVIGGIDAYYTPQGGQEELIGSLSNSNLFPELTTRTFTMPTKLAGLAPGNLRIVFKKAEGQTNDHVLLDELVIPISN